MSGDVQPRKRKDKKKKKDEFTGLAPPAEERPAHVHAPSSAHTSHHTHEGVVIMHAQHDHGTGGHWCAKLIFFILLGILIGLIGLIILENRGLSDLDTPNSESRYAAVFDGWVDEALPDDHHHDEHTFELTHPEEQDGGDLSDQENDVELEDIVKETDTQAASEGSKEKDVSDNEEENESEIDEIQDDFSDIEEEISDYAKGDFQEEFLEDEVEQEGGETAHGDDKPYEELDSAEEVVVDNAAGEQEYEERKAKEQQAAEEETSNPREQAATGDRSERRLTLMEDSLLLGTDGKLSPKETSGKRVFFSPTTTEHEANSEESEVEEEEEEQYNYEPPVKSASSFFTRSQPPIVHRAPDDEEDDDIMQVEEFSKKIGFTETQSPPLITPPKNLPIEKNEEIEVSEDEISEDEMPGDVEVISDDEVNENNEAEKPEEDEPVAEEEDAVEEDVVEEEEDEVEDVEDEEDISDVDDVELMKRLEMKYGKLPDEDSAQEPSRKRKPEGGLSVETWADEPADNQWRQQLDLAQAELDEGLFD